MIEIRYCDRLHSMPIKGADIIIIADGDITMSYIDVPITNLYDSFFEEYTNENDEVSENITEDMLIDYIEKGLLKLGYKDFHIYKKVRGTMNDQTSTSN